MDGVQLINSGSPLICHSCEHAKMTHKPIQKEPMALLANAFTVEVHMDIWGLSPLPSVGGRKYYITFTDDYTRYIRVHILRMKDQAFAAYKAFTAWVQTQHGAPVKCLCSNCSGEYTSTKFSTFLQEQGTEHRLMTHDTP